MNVSQRMIKMAEKETASPIPWTSTLKLVSMTPQPLVLRTLSITPPMTRGNILRDRKVLANLEDYSRKPCWHGRQLGG